MRAIHLFLVLSLVPHLVCAQVIKEINVTIMDDGYTMITKAIQYDSQGEYAAVKAPKFVEKIMAWDKQGPLEVNVTSDADKDTILVYFRKYQEVGSMDRIYLQYGTHYMTQKIADNWSINYETATTPRETIMKVIYPKKARILSIKPVNILLTPVEDGLWIYPQEDEFNFTSTYQFSGEKTVVDPKKGNKTAETSGIELDSNLVYGAAIAAMALAILYVAYRLYKAIMTTKKPSENLIMRIAEDVINEPTIVDGEVKYDLEGAKTPGKETKVKDSIIKVLNDDEVRIIRLLEDSENEEVTQAYIHKTLGIPKSSLSDILKHIEKRKIIERRVEGRVKWIKLKKWIFY
jgi:uncharacterized membrane protein